MHADVLVVSDMAAIPVRLEWLAVLGGHTICTWDFVCTGRGPSLTYKAATSTRRLVWFSDSDIAANSARVKLIVKNLATLKHSKWRLEVAKDSFLTAANKLAAQRRMTESIAVVTSREKTDATLSRVKHRVTGKQALALVRKVLLHKSTTGVCGR